MTAFGIGSPEGWPGLSKLIEECGELIQIAGKIIQTPDGKHWDGPLEPRLIEEMGDVLAAMRFVADYCDLSWSAVKAREREKYNLYAHWHMTGDTKPGTDG